MLTSGGYAANPELWKELTPYPLHSYCSPNSRGEGIIAAREIGALVDNGEKFLCTFAGVPNNLEDPLATRMGLALNSKFRLPWEIYVNREGKRFVREDHPSIDHKEHALLEQDGMEMFIVFDEGIRQNAPHIDNVVDRDALAQLFGKHVSYLKADTLEDLAAQAGMDPENLKESVRQHNDAIKTGDDPAFGREVYARPIDTAPYLAIRAAGCTVLSPAGLNADADLRVLDKDGKPIPGLYCAGEILGFARISGQGFVGGMSLTPALTFGRLLGQKILAWEGAREAAE